MLRPSNKFLWLSTSYCNRKFAKVSVFGREIIRIMWRVTYAHLVQVETKKIPFIVDTVVNDIYRKVMQGILAYQTTRRKFFTNRQHSNLKKILPISAANQISDLGQLNTKTGELKINPKIRALFVKHKVWTDYNKRIFKDSFKKIFHSPIKKRNKNNKQQKKRRIPQGALLHQNKQRPKPTSPSNNLPI